MMTKKQQCTPEATKNSENPSNHPHSGCCGGSGEKSATKEICKSHTVTALTTTNASASCTGKGHTRISVKYNVGFGNLLYIRGNGANLDWNKGLPMKNTKSDEWTWESTTPFTNCEFKVLINDQTFESGPNHQLKSGECVTYVPHFD